MSAKQIVMLLLLDAPAVTALVGNGISAGAAPQEASVPFIVISKPGGENRQLLEGDAGFPRTRIRLECCAASAAEASDLQSAAFDALKNVTNQTVDDGESPAFRAVATITPSDLETDGYSDQRQAFVEIFDVYVDWKLL